MRSSRHGDGGLGRKRVWVGVEEQERRVAWVVLRDHRPPSLECLLPHPLSLAVHPDGVRVASGQTAGVDKDGKVRPQSNARQTG